MQINLMHEILYGYQGSKKPEYFKNYLSHDTKNYEIWK